MTETTKPWIYRFGGGFADGRSDMKALLGGKGANLAEMASLGLPVPPGFTIGTHVCTYFYAHDLTYPETLSAEVDASIIAIEQETGMKFGDATNPLLVSVRSGAPVSMPGMMDTVLNLGLNDETVEGLAKASGDARFAFDSYRRFIQMYGDVVLGVDHYLFESRLEDLKDERGARLDTDLTSDDLRRLVQSYKAIVEKETGAAFPMDVREQLWGAVGAVFSSWMADRAISYRRIHDIAGSMGTAVNVQAMVFGNMGDDCATGVAFTRNPSTGHPSYYGEYLVNAQGEDVVAGIRTPQALTEAMRDDVGGDLSLEIAMPDAFAELSAVFARLEKHYGAVQDIEFTIQRAKLYILQTRNGKLTATAAVRIAVDMADEGIVTREKAVAMVDPHLLDQLLHPTLDPNAPRDVIVKGLPASPGAACGRIVLSAEEAEALARLEQSAILVRNETSPEDINGMNAAAGILTARGGMTSHAAVVARSMGKPCVCGATAMVVDPANGEIRVGDQTYKAGDVITIDGSDGTVMKGDIPRVTPDLSGQFLTLMEWADGFRRLKIRCNAETPNDVSMAYRFGAEGIGLCRTEHMFFSDGRIIAMRAMILAEDEAGRRAALDKILPMQRQDLTEIFRISAGAPVTIRLLDPPLNEFLPHEDAELKKVAESTNVPISRVRRRLAELSEANPMLGLRGCRLGLLYPEIYEMQAQAIFEAALSVQAETGAAVEPEIMVPLIGFDRELAVIAESIRRIGETAFEAAGARCNYQIGTMIELPRAALQAEGIAEHAEFFSFGTNDLTQMTLGLSRDDSGKFLDQYLAMNVFDSDPFISLDQSGVGELVALAVERGRAARPGIKLGICGEHGGDPRSVDFCHRVGLDYVSCSPYRVPIARLSAAQAALAGRD